MKKTIIITIILFSTYFRVDAQNLFLPGGSSGIGSSTNSKIGIGTSSPNGNLEIKGDGSAASLLVKHYNEQDGIAGLILAQKSDLSGTIECSGCDLQIGSGWDKKLTIGFLEYNTYGGKIIFPGGNVGIGTTNPSEKLSVNGKIRAHEIKVEAANWPDYVFEADYKITSLAELEKFIQVNKHLPEMPSAKEVETNGVDLGEMNKKLLQKLEELTLHVIQQGKEIEGLKKQLKKQE